ncbi:hypothetical protein [Pelagibacterium lentulum]|uniref:DUF2330 domain-containing protein n=1 Tax=Pelagibacterium lentulum TaxID=2029865 RepID=A0A916R994_9HYPH|nr:hypothetical protein [Pelagibacterium lentulum]GGA42761.1 hypothetical protein GCM10011499_10380 [Pelagibacterium lentulum]
MAIKSRFALPLLAVLVATPAAPTEHLDCSAELAAIASGLAVIQFVEELGAPKLDPATLPAPYFEEGYCRVGYLEIPTDITGTMHHFIRIDGLKWSAEWSNTPPAPQLRALTIEIDGFRPLLRSDVLSPAENYINALLMDLDKINGRIAYHIDPEEGLFHLDALEFDLRHEHVGLSASLSEVDPLLLAAEGPSPELALNVRVHEFEFRARTRSLVQSIGYVWMPLIYPEFGATPQQAVEEFKNTLIAGIAALPNGLMSSNSRTDFAEFFAALPDPEGELFISFSSSAGFSSMDILPMLAGETLEPLSIMELLEQKDAQFSASWTPGAQ